MKIQTTAVETDALLRLHLNESPYDPPRAVREAIWSETVRNSHRYPDSECTEIRRAIAEYHDLPDSMIATGNGVDELVLLAALAYAGYGTRVALTDTTFLGYRFSSMTAGAEICSVPIANYRVDATALADAIRQGAGLAFLCNPHNPTGTLLTVDEVEEIVSAAESAGSVLVIDEAYIEFAQGESSIELVRAGRQVVVLRTFSKAWSLASLRAGYAVGSAALIKQMWHARRSLPFNVNRLAQRAVPLALQHQGFLDSVRVQTAEARETLLASLIKAGVDFVDSVTNFVMISTGDADSTEVTRRLAEEHGVLVRDLALFGASGWIRVTVGTTEQVQQFYTALLAVTQSSHR
ncbi:pyridoxal phosphate-dependent aminotransferase [Nocardia gamkensis]|uniref:histidinol-phosphate transaminase n=1 Tax=Nocardia gamkensis TaxID=352869 RepID=A0A7X6KZD8_9NOCA|nr:histidinol-phosphate transaminase [Nocardia gamkensis]NKY24947.1 histidinol-phosphate aminotransferase family protein [Nocardia gamkensis]NQE66727.1 Histidinol-phosphate aminotransferase [Nocardia gamkensis]